MCYLWDMELIAANTLELVRVVAYAIGIVISLIIFSVWMARIIRAAT